MAMFKRLLLPVDLSDSNNRSIETAIELGKPGITDIHLLHVVETLHEIAFEEIESFYRELALKAEERLAEWGNRLSEEGFLVRAEVSFGKRSAMIVHVAAKQKVDLIILRAHALDAEKPTGSLGTLSHQVALLAPCSVMLIRA